MQQGARRAAGGEPPARWWGEPQGAAACATTPDGPHLVHFRGFMGARPCASRQRRAMLSSSCFSDHASQRAAIPRSRDGSATVASKTAPSAAEAGNAPPQQAELMLALRLGIAGMLGLWHSTLAIL